MVRIAVTGGAGFIGVYVMKELEAQGYEGISVDRSEGLDIINDEPAVEDVLRYASGVIHLAGVLGTAELFDSVESAIEINIKGSAKILRMCSEFDLDYVGITMPQVWDNVYQATKSAAVKLASAYYRHYNLHVSHVRAFNVFGVGQKVGLPQKIIPTFSDHAWRKKALPVWGDGNQQVDLVRVEDVARMLVQALDFGDNQTFDAGTKQSLSVKRVAQFVNEMAGSPAGIQYMDMRKGEHGQGVVASGEGWDLLGWQPHLVWDDLERTIESYRPR